LQGRISTAFGPEVMAVETDGTEVRGAGSQLGWLLWAGALAPAAAAAAVERLCRPDVLTEFGLRTLSSDSPLFEAHAYHRGSIWPFDSWLGWGGLRACGRVAEAEQVRAGVLAAIERIGDAPELYASVAPTSPSRSRSRTAAKRGRWARSGRSPTAGTGARSGSGPSAQAA
jgi:glycogen debranching enzyme